jgi:antirestriction protein ArdC
MDIRQVITDKIITLLERGTTKTGPRWTGSKAASLPINAKTGEAYHGINVLLMWAEMSERGYAVSRWLTYNQAAELGGQVRKGQKSVMCVYYQTVQKKDDGQDDDDGESYFLVKPFWVFNVAQIDGLAADITAPAPAKDFDANQEAEQILTTSQARIDYGFDKAFYSSRHDRIFLPERERFTTPENFYATALHELTHWTGHESRLNRQFGKRFGDDAYAIEELVAELGSAFTVGQLGMIDATVETHADYVNCWLKVLKGDKRAIFTAASQAAKAADFILMC